MQITDEAAKTLQNLSEEIGINWYKHQKAGGTYDDLFRCIIADGIFTTKVDGPIHAAHVTTPLILKYATEKNAGLNIETVTSWRPVNSAIRYAIWQVDFHWKIDTREWQYLLLLKYMKYAYRDAILSCDNLLDTDKKALIDLCEKFYDEVEVAYSYRMEIIERSRGFAPHPDKTAGAKDHGYTYEPIMEPEEISFSQLKIDFIGPELGAGTAPVSEHKIPKAWPRLTGEVRGGLPTAARTWLKTAQGSGIADEFLRVKLGDRNVPTRFNGWEEGILVTLKFLKPFIEGQRAKIKGRSEFGGYDLGNFSERFALCQTEFYKRLDGEAEDLVTLLKCQSEALRMELKMESDKEIKELVEEFIIQASSVIHAQFANYKSLNEEMLPELEGIRPIHPRFAPFDPKEPLPWETKDKDRYLQRMKRLGYTL